MKDIRKYAAEQVISGKEALQKRLGGEVEGFRGKGRVGLREGII